jgi:hypothetical protein
MRSGDLSPPEAKASLRRHLLEMVRVADGMQELWFACLDNLSDALRAETESESHRQRFLDHFLWDWFKKYSEARPIVRAARHFEPTDLRLANHLDGWGLAPWEPWEVTGRHQSAWQLRQLASHREIRLHRAFDHHQWEVGDALLMRVLQHGGHDFSGLSVWRLEGATGVRTLVSHWKSLAKKHGFAPTTRLRPDIHNEIWLPLHEDLLAIGLPTSCATPPTLPKQPSTTWDETILDRAQPELAGQSPREAARNELGRRRLLKWLDGQMVDHAEAEWIRSELGL